MPPSLFSRKQFSFLEHCLEMGGTWPRSLSPDTGTHSPGVEGKLHVSYSPATEFTSNDSSMSGIKASPLGTNGIIQWGHSLWDQLRYLL